MKDGIVIRADDLPLPVTIIGKRQKLTKLTMISTRNQNGAQLCGCEKNKKSKK